MRVRIIVDLGQYVEPMEREFHQLPRLGEEVVIHTEDDSMITGRVTCVQHHSWPKLCDKLAEAWIYIMT